jgi:hypothetical protein
MKKKKKKGKKGGFDLEAFEKELGETMLIWEMIRLQKIKGKKERVARKLESPGRGQIETIHIRR